MWTCKHCEQEFEFGVTQRNSKANHTRWCISNPKAVELRQENGKNNNCWNKGLTKETDARLELRSRKLKEYYSTRPGTCTGHSDVTKRKIAASMNGNRNANHRGDRQACYNGIRMDSNWEVGTARWFDENNIKWKYNERGYKLSNGRYYYPDFFIYESDNFTKLIEVKGYFREANRLKFEMFLREYPDINIELWLQEKLKALNILDNSGYLKIKI